MIDLLCYHLLNESSHSKFLDAFVTNEKRLKRVAVTAKLDDSELWRVLEFTCLYHEKYGVLPTLTGLRDFIKNNTDLEVTESWTQALVNVLKELKEMDEVKLRQASDPKVIIDEAVNDGRKDHFLFLASRACDIARSGPTTRSNDMPAGVNDAKKYIEQQLALMDYDPDAELDARAESPTVEQAEDHQPADWTPDDIFEFLNRPLSDTDHSELAFPVWCMYGRMGEWARAMDMPLGLAYPTCIGCYSVKPSVHEMCNSRVNTYVGLISPIGGGKNTAIRRGLQVTGVVPGTYKRVKPGGETQLACTIGAKVTKNKRGEVKREGGHRKFLMVTAELSDVLSKTGIDNSTLASTLCDLWDENEYEKPLSGGGRVEVDCRLSWIGGIPADLKKPERFIELFGSETQFGLYSRFIWGYSEKRFKRRLRDGDWSNPFTSESVAISEPIGEGDEDAASKELEFGTEGATVVRDIADAARARFDAWNPPVFDVDRLKYNALKVALLTASANGDQTVSDNCMRKALLFMEWQIRIREHFQPGEAKEQNKEAWFAERLLACLERAGAHENFVSWRRISLDNRWDKKIDAGVQLRTVKNLVALGRLIEESDDDDAPKSKKRYPRVKVRG